MIGFAGHLRLRAEARETGRSVLADQSFRAPFHVSKPYWDTDVRTLVVQIVNPTAGILAGDTLQSDVAVAAGASLLVTTPSASRVFTMGETGATCLQRFSVAANAWLEVAPEPLVPHRGARFRQHTEVEIEPGAGLFFVDQLVPGRIGFGEVWAWAELQLELFVRVDGILVLRERFVHSGDTLRRMALFFGSDASACFANAIFYPPQAAPPTNWMERIRALHGPTAWVGLSALRGGGYTLKIVARDPLTLRDTLTAARSALATVAPALACRVRKQ